MSEAPSEHDREDLSKSRSSKSRMSEFGSPPEFKHFVGTCPAPINGLCSHPDPDFNCGEPPP